MGRIDCQDIFFRSLIEELAAGFSGNQAPALNRHNDFLLSLANKPLRNGNLAGLTGVYSGKSVGRANPR